MDASPPHKTRPEFEVRQERSDGDELKPLFDRILDIIKSREVFRESPTFFVVYAWDNGTGTAAGSDVVQEFIRVCERAGCEIKSDQAPAVRAVTEQQLCLLPLGAHHSAVDLVVLCASDLLGQYMESSDFQAYVDDMTTAHNTQIRNDPSFVSEVYEKHYELRKQTDSTLHHVETELALLKIRANSGQKRTIIPFILSGDYRVNLPEYLSGNNDILRTVLGPKPEGDGSKYECFLKVLERLAERGKHKPGPASLIQSLRKLYTAEAKQLRVEPLTTVGINDLLLHQIDAANKLSDTWTDAQRVPTNNNELKEIREYQRRIEILKALHTSPYRDRKDINMDRVPGTCEWFVGHQLFQDWLERKTSSMLWVSADPGCGKSVLAKYLVDSVLPGPESRTICYFFFKDDFDDQKSAKSALCCILHQLFEQRPELLSDKIAERFEAYGERLTGSVGELWNILTMASHDDFAGEIICVFDAFDECDDRGKKELAQVLCSYFGAASSFNLKILLTSRPYGDIRRSFQPIEIPGLPVIHLSGESDVELLKISREIDIYIDSRVKSIQATHRLTPDDSRLLLEQLLSIPHRTYLWAHLTLDLIRNDNSIDKIGLQKATRQLPPTIDHAYEMILAKSTDATMAKKLLHIVVAAARPLTLLEMGFALTVRETDRSYESMDLKSEHRLREYLREICGLFVTVIGSRIYLLHQTAKEFLIQEKVADVQPTSNQFIWKSTFSPRESHRILSKVCMGHLLFSEFEKKPLEDIEVMPQYLDDHVFLEYSAKNWVTHVLAAEFENEAIVDLSMELCNSDTKRFSTWFTIHWAGAHLGSPKGFTTLLAASYLGLGQLVNFLLKRRTVPINSCDGVYRRSSLFLGVRLRDVLSLSLSFFQRAEIDTKDIYGRTPLSYACWNGNTDVIELLVKAGARADLEDEIGGTPMSYAIINGQKAVASLLKKDTKAMQIDSEDTVSKALLLSAAQKGHDTVVKLLFENSNVDVNVRNDDGKTPLGLAAEEGHCSVVLLLLSRRKVDVNSKDKFGRTPLSSAAANGHHRVIKLLLDTQRVDANINDLSGRTAISWASGNGHIAVLEELLTVDNIEVDSKDDSGRTPLSWAASWAVVKSLLHNGRVNCDSRDYTGRTPLSWAVVGPHDYVPHALLDSGKVNVNAKDRSGRTPLSWAAEYNNNHFMRLLLSFQADADFADKLGRTPLCWAVINDSPKAVGVLLGIDDVDPNSKDESGFTPLSWAVHKKCHNAFKVLVRNDKVNLDCMDSSGRTPLSWAAAEGYNDMVQLLLRYNANVIIKDKMGRTPLSRAVEARNMDVIKNVLVAGGFDGDLETSSNGLLILDNETGEGISFCRAPYGLTVTLNRGEVRATPDLRAGMLLRLRYSGTNTQWTAPFSTSEEGFTDIKITTADQRQRIVRADVSPRDGLTLVRLFSQHVWPMSMENKTDVEFIFWQEECRIYDNDAFDKSPAGWKLVRYRLPARSIMPYSWDYPTARDKAIIISTHGEAHQISLSTMGSLAPFKFTPLSGRTRVISIENLAFSENEENTHQRVKCILSNFSRFKT